MNEREIMTEALLDDLHKWIDRDPEGFWDHIHHLEHNYLKTLSDKDLQEMYQSVGA